MRNWQLILKLCSLVFILNSCGRQTNQVADRSALISSATHSRTSIATIRGYIATHSQPMPIWNMRPLMDSLGSFDVKMSPFETKAKAIRAIDDSIDIRYQDIVANQKRYRNLHNALRINLGKRFEANDVWAHFLSPEATAERVDTLQGAGRNLLETLQNIKANQQEVRQTIADLATQKNALQIAVFAAAQHRLSGKRFLTQEELAFDLVAHDMLTEMRLSDEIVEKIRQTRSFDDFLTTVFGSEEVGLKRAYLYLRYGYVASHYLSIADYRPWLSSELDEIISVFDGIPSFIFAYMRGQALPFVHYATGLSNADYENNGVEDVAANSAIIVFDYNDGLAVNERKHTFMHEIGHNYAAYMQSFEIDDSQQWRQLSDWFLDDGNYFSFENNFVSGYSHEDPYEDFAESFSYYRYDSSLLKRLSPQKYQFLKNFVFDGLVYNDATLDGNVVANHKRLQAKMSMPEVQKLFSRDCQRAMYALVSGRLRSPYRLSDAIVETVKQLMYFDSGLLYSGARGALFTCFKKVRSDYVAALVNHDDALGHLDSEEKAFYVKLAAPLILSSTDLITLSQPLLAHYVSIVDAVSDRDQWERNACMTTTVDVCNRCLPQIVDDQASHLVFDELQLSQVFYRPIRAMIARILQRECQATTY